MKTLVSRSQLMPEKIALGLSLALAMTISASTGYPGFTASHDDKLNELLAARSLGMADVSESFHATQSQSTSFPQTTQEGVRTNDFSRSNPAGGSNGGRARSTQDDWVTTFVSQAIANGSSHSLYDTDASRVDADHQGDVFGRKLFQGYRPLLLAQASTGGGTYSGKAPTVATNTAEPPVPAGPAIDSQFGVVASNDNINHIGLNHGVVSGGGGTIVVPEPATLSLTTLGLLGLARIQTSIRGRR